MDCSWYGLVDTLSVDDKWAKMMMRCHVDVARCYVCLINSVLQ